MSAFYGYLYNQDVRFFKNPWVRWFAGAFCFGAMAVPIAVAVYDFKDPKVEMGRFTVNSNSAWVLMALNLGLVSGALGLGIAALKNSASKTA